MFYELRFVSACYGIVSVPTGPWFCERCVAARSATNGGDHSGGGGAGEQQDQESQRQQRQDGGNAASSSSSTAGCCATKDLRCQLCPCKDGAFKRTDTGAWSHVVCALYIPEVKFGNVTTMDPIILAHIPPERFNKICFICEENGRLEEARSGACMQCNKPGCKNYFHVTCGQKEHLLFEEPGQLDNIKYCGYCPHHFKKLRKDGFTLKVPAYAFSVCENNNSSRLYTELRNMVDSDNAGDKVSTRQRKSNAVDKADVAVASSRAPVSSSPASSTYMSPGDNMAAYSAAAPPGPGLGVDGKSKCFTAYVPNSGGNPTVVDSQSTGCYSPFLSFSSTGAACAMPVPSLPSLIYPTPAGGGGDPYKAAAAYNLPQPSSTPSTISSSGDGCHPGPSSSNLNNNSNFYPAGSSAAMNFTAFPVCEPSPVVACTSAVVHGSPMMDPTAGMATSSSLSVLAAASTDHLSPNAIDRTGTAALQSSVYGTLGKQQNLASATSSLATDVAAPPTTKKRPAPQRNLKTELSPSAKKGKRTNKKAIPAPRKSSLSGATPTSVGRGEALSSAVAGSRPSNAGDASNRPCCSSSLPTADSMAKQPMPATTLASDVRNRTEPSVNCGYSSAVSSAASVPVSVREVRTSAAGETFLRPAAQGSNVLSLSFEQLLERQWEQGSQFLMEQAQHFDIASLLTCLHQLKCENKKYEDHIASLVTRRDHLLAVNARLSLPLSSHQNSAAAAAAHHVPVSFPTFQQGDQTDPSLSTAGTPVMTSHGGTSRPTTVTGVVPPQNVPPSRPFLVQASNAAPAVTQDGSGSGRGSVFTATTATTSPVTPTTSTLIVNGVTGFANVRPKNVNQNVSPEKQSSFLIHRTPTPLMSTTDLVKPAAANILSSQFSVANQDVHHQQMLYQLMQHQAVAAAAVYGNAFPGFMPSTSPHVSNSTAMMPPAQSMLHAPYPSQNKNP